MTVGRGGPLVFAMITTRASQAYTPIALRSFFEHTPDHAIDRFLLIDNDGSFGQGDLPARTVTMVRPPAPRGFAQNANAALDEARARRSALCLLNNDLVFTEGWFEPLLEDRRALLSPVSNAHVTYDIDGWSTRASMDLADYLGHEAQFDELARRHRASHEGYRRVAAVPFYGITIPASVYETVGPFDEGFGPAGGEDRDYTVRAWLAGIPQELAVGSYVLHFQGKSTWRGIETPIEIEARNRQYIRAFEAKWGPALSHAFLHEDWNLFRTDAKLTRWIAEGQYTPLVRYLRSHPSLAPFVERLSHARFSGLCCLDAGDDGVPALDPVYGACDAIWILVNDTSPTAACSAGPTVAAIDALPDPAGKLHIVRGRWPDEASQRNEGLRLIQESGADYGFVVDADEAYDPAEVRAAMALARQHPHIDCWRIPRAPAAAPLPAGEPSDATPPAVFLRAASATFVERRTVAARRQAAISADVAVIRRRVTSHACVTEASALLT